MAERFGRYLLLKRLASGGMGELFLAQPAEAPRGERLLAVKTLLPGLSEDPDLVMMFLDEARLAAQLHHPNICQIVDLGQEDGVLFMALEYIHGEDLDRLQRTLGKQNRRVPLHLVARIVADAARGLHFAHQLADGEGRPVGLIHRDISPQNVLVTFQGVTKIIDFGLAKAAGRATRSQSGSLKGKFAYMSPEMVSNEKVDHRHDVFALGIVLWELVTGQRLFKADSEVATIALVARCDVAAPSSINPDVPPALDQVCLRALAKEKARRYQTADELRAALEFFLASQKERHAAADLAAFMRETYAERLAREEARGVMWDVQDAPEHLVVRRRVPGQNGPIAKALRRAQEPAEGATATEGHDAKTDQARLDDLGMIVRTDRVQLGALTGAGGGLPPRASERDVSRTDPRPAAPPATNAVDAARRKPLASLAPLPPPPPLQTSLGPDEVKGYTAPAPMPRTAMSSTVSIAEIASSPAAALPVDDRPPLRHKRVWFGVALGILAAVLAAAAVSALLS